VVLRRPSPKVRPSAAQKHYQCRQNPDQSSNVNRGGCCRVRLFAIANSVRCAAHRLYGATKWFGHHDLALSGSCCSNTRHTMRSSSTTS